jgi:hypothetical protein
MQNREQGLTLVVKHLLTREPRILQKSTDRFSFFHALIGTERNAARKALQAVEANK